MPTLINNPRETVIALIDSYLSMRKADWKIDDYSTAVIKPNSTTAQKLKICHDVVEAAQQAASFDSWVNLIYLLDDFRRIEDAARPGNRLGGYAKPFVESLPINLFIDNKCRYLLSTLDAALTYVLSKITSADILKLKSNLESKEEELQKSIRADEKNNIAKESIQMKRKQIETLVHQREALDCSKDYFISHFNALIKEKDPMSKEFGEKSFEDFEANINKKRMLTYVKQIGMIVPAPEPTPELKTDKHKKYKYIPVTFKPKDVTSPSRTPESDKAYDLRGRNYKR